MGMEFFTAIGVFPAELFAYFTQFSNLNIPELMQIFANGKRPFHSFMELYVIHSKNPGVKI